MSFYTSYSPLKQMVSSNKIFYWSSKPTHKVRTISVLFTPAWVMICLLDTLFFVFPIDTNQKPLLSFCWFSASYTHYTRTHLFFFHIHVYFSVTKEPVSEWEMFQPPFVAEGSALYCPAPVPCKSMFQWKLTNPSHPQNRSSRSRRYSRLENWAAGR